MYDLPHSAQEYMVTWSGIQGLVWGREGGFGSQLGRMQKNVVLEAKKLVTWNLGTRCQEQGFNRGIVACFFLSSLGDIDVICLKSK